jgi:hypothetical protein
MQLAALAEKNSSPSNMSLTSKETDVPKRKAKLSFVEFPFTFDIGDEAFYKQEKVTIKDGTFEEDQAGVYQITYVTKTADGQIRQIPQCSRSDSLAAHWASDCSPVYAPGGMQDSCTSRPESVERSVPAIFS